MHRLTEAPGQSGPNRCACKPIVPRRPAPRHACDQQRGPGGVLLLRVLEGLERVSLRTVTLRVPPQDVITRDNGSAGVPQWCASRPGAADGFSLEGVEGFHFISRTPRWWAARAEPRAALLNVERPKGRR
jgi:hypothetical protein